jgi:hypothetical protein
MTEKCPAQSSRSSIRAASIVPTPAGSGIGRRRRIMPDAAGSFARHANSPKSLSNVTRIRFSRTAMARTSTSPAAVEALKANGHDGTWIRTSANEKFPPAVASKRISCRFCYGVDVGIIEEMRNDPQDDTDFDDIDGADLIRTGLAGSLAQGSRTARKGAG